jgi:hypothetical protein
LAEEQVAVHDPAYAAGSQRQAVNGQGEEDMADDEGRYSRSMGRFHSGTQKMSNYPNQVVLRIRHSVSW